MSIQLLEFTPVTQEDGINAIVGYMGRQTLYSPNLVVIPTDTERGLVGLLDKGPFKRLPIVEVHWVNGIAGFDLEDARTAAYDQSIKAAELVLSETKITVDRTRPDDDPIRIVDRKNLDLPLNAWEASRWRMAKGRAVLPAICAVNHTAKGVSWYDLKGALDVLWGQFENPDPKALRPDQRSMSGLFFSALNESYYAIEEFLREPSAVSE